MLRGTYQQMAHKIWQHKVLKVELMKDVIGATAAECSELCSTKKPSVARCSKDDMLQFHPEALCEEWMKRAPTVLFCFTVFCLVRKEERCEDSDLTSKCCFGRLNIFEAKVKGHGCHAIVGLYNH